MSLDQDDHSDLHKHTFDLEWISYELPEFERKERLVFIHISELFFIVNGCDELRITWVSNQPDYIFLQSLWLQKMII